jgi:arylsulfatase A-like enzyme
MFDSLNRHMLSAYGCDWTRTPNFQRLSERTLTFDTSYICSMPCMPARRDFHTGRPNFLHRSWGPLEPFDDSVPEILKDNGVYAHLCSDHYHYWEDGGATYHPRYSTWESYRGQEGDPWFGQVSEPELPEGRGRNAARDRSVRQDAINRAAVPREDQQPQPRTFAAGLDFLRRNANDDNWFLQLETFDPHEPFFSSRKYKDLYNRAASRVRFDWPAYGEVNETPEEIEQCRYEYAALLSMCDAYLGDVLDTMDELKLWDDTMLVVWTDHGFLLGEHDCWAKLRMPWYEELARTPFFVWDPRSKNVGERRQSLVQPAIDLGPTLLDFFGLEPTGDMLGKNLRPVIEHDAPVREVGIFGVFGGQVNVTDGRHVYMRATQDYTQPLPNFTLMPTHMNRRFAVEELRDMEIAEPFGFTKGCRILKIGGNTPMGEPDEKSWALPESRQNLLFDVQADPAQQAPLQNAELEARLTEQMQRLMKECEAPPEQFERLGLA